ncbi:hypothetical protein A1O1_06634 [Capronia coronata CBS 617.96]|uniref:Uncharacterized protein n=1 Tax=Capronia coronata CBS 617.96 TaxID=1182541 RepID=W9YVF5_9EURO|nr:uncharacterized protein A1O1_06634 [Capronia coronata CBS 617.96]EXJ86264.1 hypothetical protein A1O1_06634 [Capronia coronata CBS 617.96]
MPANNLSGGGAWIPQSGGGLRYYTTDEVNAYIGLLMLSHGDAVEQHRRSRQGDSSSSQAKDGQSSKILLVDKRDDGEEQPGALVDRLVARDDTLNWSPYYLRKALDYAAATTSTANDAEVRAKLRDRAKEKLALDKWRVKSRGQIPAGGRIRIKENTTVLNFAGHSTAKALQCSILRQDKLACAHIRRWKGEEAGAEIGTRREA